MPHYNGVALLEKTLGALRRQTCQDFELIIVDDCSLPDSHESLNAAALRFGAVLVFQNENRGPSAARNKGVALAKGVYICFLDSDDLWERTYLEQKRREISRSGANVLLSPGYSFRNRQVTGKINHIQKFSQLMIFTNPIGCPSGVVVKADVAKTYSFHEGFRMFEDYLYYIKHFKVGDLYLSKAIFFYRMEGQNTTGKLVSQRTRRWVELLQKEMFDTDSQSLRYRNSLLVTWRYGGRNVLVPLLSNPFVWLRLVQRAVDLLVFRWQLPTLRSRLEECMVE